MVVTLWTIRTAMACRVRLGRTSSKAAGSGDRSGAGAGSAAARCGARKASTSARFTSGRPVARAISARSSPSSRADLRAAGEASTRPGGTARGAGPAAAAWTAGLRRRRGAAAAGLASASAARSASSPTQAMTSPAVAVSPSSAIRLSSLPWAKLSTETVALSVSTSSRTSPRATASPTFFSQRATTSWSVVWPASGIVILWSMGSPTSPCLRRRTPGCSSSPPASAPPARTRPGRRGRRCRARRSGSSW